MRTISAQQITDAVARLCIEANTRLPRDVQEALDKARAEEPLAAGKEHPRPALVEPRGGERRESAHLSGYRHGLRLRGAGYRRPYRRQL